MKKILLSIFLPIIVLAVLNSKTLTLSPATYPIIIDGAGDEDAWIVPAFNNMDQIKGDAANKNNTAKFKITYDDKNIYLYYEILDAKLDTSQSKNVWEKDCVELYLSMDTSSRAVIAGADGYIQLRKIFGRDMTDFVFRPFYVAENDIAGGKAIEWQLPIDSITKSLKIKSLWDGHNFRFDCQNGDNDGSGRLSQLFWNSNADDQWNHTRNLGFVYLSQNVIPTSSTKTITIEKTAENINIDGNSTESTWNNEDIAKWIDVTENKGTVIYKNNTVKYKMAYDKDFLYVLVQVKDATLDVTQSSVLTEKDGIELCFSMDTVSSNSYRSGDSKILKVYSLAFNDQLSKGYQVKETNITGGYQQEWKLSWESLAGSSNFSKKYFKFECINNDNDNYGKNSQIFWNSNYGDQESTNKHFGIVKINNQVNPNSPKTLEIKKTNETMSVDGNAMELSWNSVLWTNLYVNKGDIADKNNTVKFKMIYDNDYIYILDEIKDNDIDTSQSRNFCEKDGTELFFAMDTTNSSYPKFGDTYLRKIFGRDFTDLTNKGYEVKEKAISDGYRQEWKLPIFSLINGSNFNDKVFRFEIKNNDNDGYGRKSQLYWSSQNDSWPGVVNQGFVTLGDLLPYSGINVSKNESSIIIRSGIIELTKSSDYAIFSVTGQLMLQGRNTNKINISNLPEGVYIVSANGENKKFIK